MRKDQSKPFTWGRVIAEHEVGRYHVVEYDDFKSGVWDRREKRETTGNISYAVYVDGEDIHFGTSSLDAALIAAVAFARIGHKALHELDMVLRALKVVQS